MIRPVALTDVKAITAIYNDFVLNSVVTFEVKPISEEEMTLRVSEISAHFPYFVYESEGEVVGYCYAHLWKERAAYKETLETTVYVSSRFQKKGIGKQLMTTLIETCRKSGYYALIACITGCNEPSRILHSKLGYKQVSFFEGVGMKFGHRLDVVDYELRL